MSIGEYVWGNLLITTVSGVGRLPSQLLTWIFQVVDRTTPRESNDGLKRGPSVPDTSTGDEQTPKT